MSVQDDITLFTVRDKPWSYRAEGNGNLVISLPNMGKILRLVKTEETTSSCHHQVAASRTSNQPPPADAAAASDLRRLVSFIGETMAPLLGRNFVQPGEIVRISSEELLWLNDKLQPLRPESRRHKTLGQKDSLALLQSDHCSAPPEPSADLIAKGLKLIGSIVTVEIKPKMGFLPTRTDFRTGSDADLISPPDTICRYHLMQLRKLEQRRIADLSGYCPLDLFSGCWSRMTDCVRQLLLNPQNNFRIFHNGSLVYGENLEDQLADVIEHIFPDVTDSNQALERLCRITIEALLFDHPVDDVDNAYFQGLPRSRQEVTCQCRTYNGSSLEETTSSIRHVCKRGRQAEVDDGPSQKCSLPDGCILSRLLAAQMLHTSDARSVISAYESLLPKVQALPPEVTMSLLYGRRRVDCESVKLIDVADLEDDDVHQIRRYLLSCTARDCSIMLKLCQLENEFKDDFHTLLPRGHFVITDSADGVVPVSFLCCPVFVDLDWKLLSRIPKHAEEDAILYNLWASRSRATTT